MREISILKQRILQYLDYKGITKYKFYQDTGVSNGVLSQSNELSGKNIEKILSYYRDLSPEWLHTGKGSMLKTETTEKTELVKTEVVEDLTEQIKVSSMVPVDLVRAQNVRIWDFIERHKDMYKTIPDMLIPNHDLTHEVRSNALSPAIEKGDYLFLQHLNLSTDSIVNGHIYFIDTKPNGIVIKKVFIDDGKLVCYSLYGKRPVKTYTIDDIFDIFSIVGMIKLSITTTDDCSEQKEQQFDKLIDTNRDLIGQNTKLIDEMAKQREMMERMMESRNI